MVMAMQRRVGETYLLRRVHIDSCLSMVDVEVGNGSRACTRVDYLEPRKYPKGPQRTPQLYSKKEKTYDESARVSSRLDPCQFDAGSCKWKKENGWVRAV